MILLGWSHYLPNSVSFYRYYSSNLYNSLKIMVFVKKTYTAQWA